MATRCLFGLAALALLVGAGGYFYSGRVPAADSNLVVEAPEDVLYGVPFGQEQRLVVPVYNRGNQAGRVLSATGT